MLTSFKLLNYRGFGDFELTGLGRVNLLVGANNSGKTSILEAVGLFASSGDMSRLWSTMSSRGEWLLHDRSQRGADSGFALPYLFHGYRVDRGAEIRLEAGRADGRHSSLRLAVTEPPDDAPKWWRRGNDAEPRLLLGALQIIADDRVIPPSIPISDGWGIEWADIVELSRTRIDSQIPRAPVQLITTAAMSAEELVELVDAIQLTDEETHVLQALQIIEPRISQFRPTLVGTRRTTHAPGMTRQGVILKLSGVDPVLPIGTLGEGAWRMLGLALALAAARGGVLLFDEIDTGLHYTVMEKMWQLVLETATRLDVQVFATSHSRDCYESLAAIAEPNAPADRRITIQRIDPAHKRAVLFTEQDILNAAKRGIEVR